MSDNKPLQVLFKKPCPYSGIIVILKLQSVEIIENKAIPADIIGEKSCVLDVRAVLENNDRVDIEVQLRNLGNMDRRSLFYWSREFINYRHGKVPVFAGAGHTKRPLITMADLFGQGKPARTY